MKNAPHSSASAHQRRGSRAGAGAGRATGAGVSIINLRGRLDARVLRAVDDGYTVAPANWAPARRPVRPPAGVHTGWKCDQAREEGDATVKVATADLICRARAGDGDAFRELTEPHRRDLQLP